MNELTSYGKESAGRRLNAVDGSNNGLIAIWHGRGNYYIELVSPTPDSPANDTSAAIPPIVIRTSLASLGGAPDRSWPAGAAGLVGPNPVPNSRIVSPGRARRVVRSAPNRAGGPR